MGFTQRTCKTKFHCTTGISSTPRRDRDPPRNNRIENRGAEKMQYARDTKNPTQPTSTWGYTFTKPMELPTLAGRDTQHVSSPIPRLIHLLKLAKLLLTNCRLIFVFSTLLFVV